MPRRTCAPALCPHRPRKPALRSSRCKKNYYLDASKTCQPCKVANCEACSSTGTCATCKAGFFVNGEMSAALRFCAMPTAICAMPCRAAVCCFAVCGGPQAARLYPAAVEPLSIPSACCCCCCRMVQRPASAQPAPPPLEPVRPATLPNAPSARQAWPGMQVSGPLGMLVQLAALLHRSASGIAAGIHAAIALQFSALWRPVCEPV